MELNKDTKKYVEDMRLLVTYPAHVYQPIKDIATVVFNSFFDYGIDVDLKGVAKISDLNALATSATYSHILSINTHDYLEAERNFYLDKPKVTRLMTYNLEQTPIEKQNSYWASMRLNEVGYYGMYFDYIVSESFFKDEDILNMGFRVLNLNLPYHPCLDYGTQPTLEDKKYDIVFIGCGSERRQELVKKLETEGLIIAPAPLPNALDSKYKASMVKESKLCLNVHFSDMEYFEKPRILYDYFMNRGVVISEKILYSEVFEHLKHLYMAKYHNLIPMIILLLNKYNDEILQMGYQAYEKFKEVHDYNKLIPTFLNQLYTKEKLFKRIK